MAARTPSLLVVGMSPDKANTNVRLNACIAEGARESGLFEKVGNLPWDVLLDDAPKGFSHILLVGSAASGMVPFELLARYARREQITLIAWTHEDPYEFDLNRRLLPFVDFLFTNEIAAVPYYESEKVSWLPLAGDKQFYRPVAGEADRVIDLFFCGYGYPNRIALMKDIGRVCSPDFNVSFFGDGLEGLPAEISVNRRMSIKDMAETASRSLATLNIGRSLDIANNVLNLVGETPGPRTFDIALSGSPQIIFNDGVRIMDFLELGSQILTFDSALDVYDSLSRLRSEAGLAASIGRAAQERVLADHLYKNRIVSLMRHIGL